MPHLHLLPILVLLAAGPGRADSSHVTLAGPRGPGERLVITGRVVDTALRPRAGVRMRVYQADAGGNYADTAGAPLCLEGWLRTDGRGRYEVRTIRPGSYGGFAAHLHVEIHEGWGEVHRYEVRFADDPHMRPGKLEAARREGTFAQVRPVERGADGVWRMVRDFQPSRSRVRGR